MTTLQLNQELLRQVSSISNDDNLLQKVINYIKSITPAKRAKDDVADEKKVMLENIMAMTKPCPLSDEEIEKEIERGREEFYNKEA